MILSTQRLWGLELREHLFELPLDHAAPEREQLEVYVRELVARENVGRLEELPCLVFFQGGPGFPSPRPQGRSGWLARAVRDHRVLLLDQRGTGRSTPVCATSVVSRGTPSDQARYLGHFRADSIVRDAELIRRELLGPGSRWRVLGQSFGGFCVVAYLSLPDAGEVLDGALITGGLPGLATHADDVYRATYPIVRSKNEAWYRRYPGDAQRLSEVLEHLAASEVHLPTGDRLTPRRLQLLGLSLGMSDGFEALHYLFESAFTSGGNRQLSHSFLRGVENAQSFDTNPIFAILHEACYGQDNGATAWSAHRLRAEFPEFDHGLPDGRPLLTGEMIYPWMFEELGALAPMREAAELLAAREDWPRLYDHERLARNEVPVAAAVYHEDMYVPRELSLATAAAIPKVRTWVTSEHEHNGLRAAGEQVLDHLLGLLEEDA